MPPPMECPVDFVTVNENRVRVTAAIVFFTTIGYCFIQHWMIPLFLVFDFAMRAFNTGKYSLLQWISGIIVKWFRLSFKAVDRAPKRFAAATGFVISLMILIFSILDLITLSLCFSALILVFSFLESAVGFCAGCYVYAFTRKKPAA